MSTNLRWRSFHTRKTSEGIWLWFFKIISGGLILVILAVHFVVNHLVGDNGLLTYQDIINYYQNPIIPAMEIIFLVFVVSHALVGVRSVFLDLRPSPSVIKVLNFIFIVIGLAAITWGSWLILTIINR